MFYNKISLQGLRQVLRKFDEDGMYASGTHWSIGRGGYDLQWELSYDRVPIIDCVGGVLENNCLSDEDFKRISKVIREEYRWVKK